MKVKMIKVERGKLEACMSCPLCNDLFKDATTVSECLHTFCKRCIYEKINEEDLNNCPVCNVDLGCAPLEKLRADNTLQGLRLTLFTKKSQSTSGEVTPRRKEKSLSSLAAATPGKSMKSMARRKRSRHNTGKDHLQVESKMTFDEPNNMSEYLPEIPSLQASCDKKREDRRQELDTAPHTEKHMVHNSSRGNADASDLWLSLNWLAEAVKGMEYNESNPLQNHTGLAQHNSTDNGGCFSHSKECSNNQKSSNNLEVHVNGNDASPALLKPLRRRKCQNGGPTREFLSKELSIAAQTEVHANLKSDRYYSPIWLSLVASEDQDSDPSLPQIPPCYLRICDGSLPVSIIKKYLAKKLGLASEAEVEISARGQPVIPTLRLCSLVDWWVQTAAPAERVRTYAGSSAKDFVMVLSYSRKACPA